jgi:transposase
MIPSRARVWIAMGYTDMRRGMQGLSLQVQEGLKRDPNGAISSSSVGAADRW